MQYFIGMENIEKIEQNISLIEDIQEPASFNVIFLNDDYTTQDFVVAVLITIFHKNEKDAWNIMRTVHEKGRGVVGAYTYDIATTRCHKVRQMAKLNGFPLQCVLEKL